MLMEKIKIGKVTAAVGLKGEIKVYHYSDYKERFEEISQLYLENTKHQIEHVRYQKNLVILKLPGIDDRNKAEEQKNKDVYIGEDQLRKLPEDTHYIKDLIGMTVQDKQGSTLGVLIDVIQNTAHDIYEVETLSKKKILIPAITSFVPSIDLKNRIIQVDPPKGLLEL